MTTGDKIRGFQPLSDSCRLVLASLFPLVTFALQWFFWDAIQPYAWFLFYPAVFFSSWVGGKWAGLAATATSTIVVWWCFIPTRYTFSLERPSATLAMAAFAAMGILFTLTHERLRKANRQAAAALASANAARDHLEERIGERTADLERSVVALLESETKYRLTLDSMLEGCQIVGFDWRYRYLNEAAEKHNRRPNAELLGKTVMECWPGITETRIFELQKSCMEQRTTRKLDTEFTFPDGHRGWFRVIMQPAPEGIVIFSEDITNRKQAERELEEQEALLRLVLETIPVGVWIIDAQGTIVMGNQASQRIWQGARYVGIDQYDQYKGWWTDSGRLIGAQEWAAARAITKGETSLDEEIDIECFDGARKTILHSAVPLRDAEQRITGAVVVIQDISARKQADRALRLREADLKKAQEIAKLGSWTADLSGRLSWWSDELYRIYGVSPETFTPCLESFLNLIHPEDRPVLQSWIDACTAGEKLGELEFRAIRPDGAVRFISGHGELVHDVKAGPHLAGTAQDITERKLAEAALAESESAFRATFEQAAVGMARVAPDGRWLQVNQRLCEVVGYSRDELLTMTFQELTHHDDLDEDLGYLRLLLAGAIETCSMEKRYLRKDLNIVWVNLTIGLVRDSAGAPDYFICVVEDISKRKRAEEALAEKQSMLEEINANLEQRIAKAVLESREKDRIVMQQGRQAAMGEMIGNIAHQWRQPLNTLGLIVQELLMTYGREEFNKESLEANVRKAMKLISHMSKTIEDFRNYFKPDKEKIVFNVNEAVTKALFLVESSLKNLDIQIDLIEKDHTEINGYANEYSQALLNILINCRDAFEGGTIDRQRFITITVCQEDGRSVVTVADNAGGVPEGIVDKIFDPYFTTKGPDKGTGIGLYMAKTIIEKNMGGRLAVRNTAEGAEFRIEV